MRSQNSATSTTVLFPSTVIWGTWVEGWLKWVNKKAQKKKTNNWTSGLGYKLCCIKNKTRRFNCGKCLHQSPASCTCWSQLLPLTHETSPGPVELPHLESCPGASSCSRNPADGLQASSDGAEWGHSYRLVACAFCQKNFLNVIFLIKSIFLPESL